MKKIRCFLAAIALVATLGGFSLQGMGSIANATSSRNVSSIGSSFAVGRYPPCGSSWDC